MHGYRIAVITIRPPYSTTSSENMNSNSIHQPAPYSAGVPCACTQMRQRSAQASPKSLTPSANVTSHASLDRHKKQILPWSPTLPMSGYWAARKRPSVRPTASTPKAGPPSIQVQVQNILAGGASQPPPSSPPATAALVCYQACEGNRSFLLVATDTLSQSSWLCGGSAPRPPSRSCVNLVLEHDRTQGDWGLQVQLPGPHADAGDGMPLDPRDWPWQLDVAGLVSRQTVEGRQSGPQQVSPRWGKDQGMLCEEGPAGEDLT